MRPRPDLVLIPLLAPLPPGEEGTRREAVGR
jgi:hypothetical protein